MEKIRVALLQLVAAGADQTANAAKGEAACREAARRGADIALFPEMWNVGYYGWGDAGHDAATLAAQAIASDGPFVRHFRALASELDMAVALTYLEQHDGGPRNAMTLIDRYGESLFTYAKVHTCDFGDEAALTPGHTFYVAPLDTKAGPVMVGGMICFDLLFPEAARVLMLEGAELILVPNASRNDENHQVCLRARAHENMVAVALANYASPQQTGGSVAFDAVSYAIDEDGAPTVDPTVVRAGSEEGIFMADFDIARIRRFREAETQGDAYRKPASYPAVTRAGVAQPFIRSDARRERDRSCPDSRGAAARDLRLIVPDGRSIPQWASKSSRMARAPTLSPPSVRIAEEPHQPLGSESIWGCLHSRVPAALWQRINPLSAAPGSRERSGELRRGVVDRVAEVDLTVPDPRPSRVDAGDNDSRHWSDLAVD
jgi:predicted amidohydrolase